MSHTAVVRGESGTDDAWVQRLRYEARRVEPTRERSGEPEVVELRVGVLCPTTEVALPLQIVERWVRVPMRATGHGQHTGRRARPRGRQQRWQQSQRQRDVAQMIEREGALEAVRRDLAVQEDRAHVVGEHVDAWRARQDPVGHGVHLVLS